MKIQYFMHSLLLILLIVHAQSVSQSSLPIDNLVVEAKDKFDEGEEEESLKMYEEILERDPENYDALWNASILYARQGYRLENTDDQKEKYQKAMVLAEKAVDLHPDKGHSYYALAVAKGRMTEIMGTRDRIRAAHEIQNAIGRAAELIPDYPYVWHLWGVWHSDVSNVGRTERIAARFISSGLPRASNEKAEEYLKKAIEMKESNILFRLDLARHYIEAKEKEKAKEVLEDLVKMEPVTKNDPEKIESAHQLLENLR